MRYVFKEPVRGRAAVAAQLESIGLSDGDRVTGFIALLDERGTPVESHPFELTTKASDLVMAARKELANNLATASLRALTVDVETGRATCSLAFTTRNRDLLQVIAAETLRAIAASGVLPEGDLEA